MDPYVGLGIFQLASLGFFTILGLSFFLLFFNFDQFLGRYAAGLRKNETDPKLTAFVEDEKNESMQKQTNVLY